MYVYIHGQGEGFRKGEKLSKLRWSIGMKVWNYLQQCCHLNSAISVSTGAHSSPPTLSYLSKLRKKIASPHTAAPLAATTKEWGSAIFRFGVGNQPNLSSTTRACAEITETLELNQDSTSLPTSFLDTQPCVLISVVTNHLWLSSWSPKSTFLCFSQPLSCYKFYFLSQDLEVL